jgi:hypothetical protein
MIEPLFIVPIFKYQTKDWNFKKKKILTKLQKNFKRSALLESFDSDRGNMDSFFKFQFRETFSEEFEQFSKEIGINDIKLDDVWSVNYNLGDYQGPHNHRSYSYSGILYLEYDENLHKPTIFLGPWNNPITDKTQLGIPQNVKEGTIIFFPSALLHYAPANKSHKKRTIISFDLLL